MCSPDIFLGLIAILFPPIAVWVKCGICSADSIINICLCMLGYIPGLLHAWYIIAKFPENDYDAIPGDAETGRVTYVFVQGPNGSPQRVPKNSVRPIVPGQGPSSGYGTTAPMNPTQAPQVHQDSNGTWSNAAEGSSGGGVPPTYAEAVKGDHKIQTQD
jgi:uncharacterized membrane protein YqaE (UPF0057 family)